MKQLKGFTLVELLIVIVIIGILMSALLPRLQGAQDIARDTSRQTALSQLQGGIVAYYSLNGRWPKISGTVTSGCTTGLEDILRQSNLMNSLPVEPNEGNVLTIGGDGANSKRNVTITGGYYYEFMNKNKTNEGGLLLVAKTETPGKSNYPCSHLTGDDVKDIHYCKMLGLSGEADSNIPPECQVEDSTDYCYILVY